jgi:N-acetyl-gamma-glutamyl-phosphate reductase
MTKVFVNGSNGTTGLRIMERLAARRELETVTLPEDTRKDLRSQADMARKADITILCLPDGASRDLIAQLGDTAGRVLDASTAFRTDARFAYGFPELSDAHAQAVGTANRVSVPGCHASGAVALLYPLVTAGLLPRDALLAVTSLTGYSGGGKPMIAEYEAAGRDAGLGSPRPYGVTQAHKHLPEIVHLCGLTEAPVFQPIVADFYCGMLVTVPLHAKQLCGKPGLAEVTALYAAHYAGKPLITVLKPNPEPFMPANALARRDGMQVFVTGNDERLLLCARFDNLGKGASGAAIQCMNIMLGLPETTGLVV